MSKKGQARVDKHFPLQFNYIPYPLWRKYVPSPLRPIADQVYRRFYPVDTDRIPPQDLATLADYLRRWALLQPDEIAQLEQARPQIADPQRMTATPFDGKIRLPAPWEPLRAVIINFPILYPPLWEQYRQLIAAISQVADVEITIPAIGWAQGIAHYLEQRNQGQIDLERVSFLPVPTDDIWVRDHGPFIGYDREGSRQVIKATYATHPRYPQARDNAMAANYAAFQGLGLREIPLNTEGGNFLTDGEGTLIMTRHIFESNPGLDRAGLERLLHDYFDFEKLIITPRVRFESTGHVDLSVKLIDRRRILISAPTTLTTRRELTETIALFKGEQNARGESYQVELLPTEPLYYNWFFYPIRRSYTNALTVNGRILMPTYGVSDDVIALATYRRFAPEFEIVPIDCEIGANGGGAVHCITKEVPAAYRL